MYIAQAWLRGYWNWICVGTGRDWQLFQNKKVQFCCRGRFLSSARMELIFFDNMAFGSWAKMEFCFKMAFEIRFWCGGYSILTRNPILAQDPTAMLAKTKLHSGRREKNVLQQNWVDFVLKKIGFSLYSIHICQGPINPQSDLCYVYWLC